MENRQESAIVPHVTLAKKKKKAGPMNFFRVAMHAFRFGRGKSKSTQVQAASALRNVVGSMRPLHLQNDQTPSSPPPPPPPKAALPAPEPAEQVLFTVEPFEAYTPSISSSSWASPSASTASRYASANDLLQLLRKESEFDEDDEESDEDEEDKYYDDKCGDDMIDSKADAFIASFYAQMRNQLETHHRR